MRGNISIFNPISTNYLFTKKKIAVVSVINDLSSDIRVRKSCDALRECGYEVVLFGRQVPGSSPLPDWPWKSVRIKMLFHSGPLFYLFFNLRLFFFLLKQKSTLLFSNDLDTLLPNFLISKLKRLPLIYDSHEIFCEVPELQQNPFKKRIWQALEAFVLPRLRYCITVNDSIALYFKTLYGRDFISLRNIPPFLPLSQPATRADLNLPENKKLVLLQGAGINVDRGAEELVRAMAFVENTCLVIIGSGDVWPRLKELARPLSDRVILIHKLPKEQLVRYTALADLGISIDKDTNLNYRFSLPNKLFDYFQAGLPVLASDLPEIASLIRHYAAGEFIESHQPEHLAERMTALLNSPNLPLYRENAKKAAGELSWENEKIKLLDLITRAGGSSDT